jgi:hypothetical protein
MNRRAFIKLFSLGVGALSLPKLDFFLEAVGPTANAAQEALYADLRSINDIFKEYYKGPILDELFKENPFVKLTSKDDVWTGMYVKKLTSSHNAT